MKFQVCLGKKYFAETSPGINKHILEFKKDIKGKQKYALVKYSLENNYNFNFKDYKMLV